jgi:hypothetical protein
MDIDATRWGRLLDQAERLRGRKKLGLSEVRQFLGEYRAL